MVNPEKLLNSWKKLGKKENKKKEEKKGGIGK